MYILLNVLIRASGVEGIARLVILELCKNVLSVRIHSVYHV